MENKNNILNKGFLTLASVVCPECEEIAARPATRDCTITHNDRELVVSNLECYRCDACGTEQVRPDQIRRNQVKIMASNDVK